MRTSGRQSPLVGGSLLAIGLAALVAGAVRREAAHAPAPDLGAPAEQLKKRIDGALAVASASLEPDAAKAARISALGAAWKMGADAATYQDLVDNEEWWAPYRARFALAGVVPASGPAATRGPAAGDLASNPFVVRARATGAASGLLTLPSGAAFLAATARIAAPPGAALGDGGPLVLLAEPLDQERLQSLVGLDAEGVGLSDGARLLAARGPAASRPLLESLVGHEGRPTTLPGGRFGAAWPFADRLWLLGVSAPGAVSAPPPPDGPWLLIGGACASLLGLVALARRGARAEIVDARTDPGAPEASDPLPQELPRAAATMASPSTGTRAWGADPATSGPGHAPTAAAAAASAPSELREMGRYRLIERIGEGGMAEIFFAAAYGAEDFVRHFVLKRMHPHLARRQEVVNQFIDEARLQAGLVHSNIVPVFDFGKAGDEYYLALEYIHGRDVGQIVQQHVTRLGRPLDVPNAFFILHEVLDALSFAHSQTSKDGTPMEIVHRDVAPGNVLVSYRGEIKLTDFGIAKSERRVSRTEVGMVKGNASFMSPEQARGESVDHRSDIFSAGLVLFYCLTGNFLYAGDNTLNQLLRAAVGPVTSQFSQIGELPAEAAVILRRAIAQDPADRYATAAEFERDVASLMGARQDLAKVMETLFPTAERRDLRQDRLASDPRS